MFPPPRRQDGDAAIRLTDSDAALARLSAVKKHYLTDPFILPFIARPHLQPHRPPLINIGTYVRSEALDDLVDQWLTLADQEGKPCQIVSFGAGSDTRFWRIATGPKSKCLSKYVELDFSEITTKKAMAIRKSKELSALLGRPEDVTLGGGGSALHSPVYHLLPTDLRLPPSQSFGPLLAAAPTLLSPSLPTLLLFECVLVYMTPACSSALIQWFTDYFAGATESGVLGAVVYEMFNLRDAFGKVMVNNLKARNVTLPGAEPYPTVASLPSRFSSEDFDYASALTLREIRRAYIAPSELERIAQLEMLDEIEELELVLEHYAITWGVKLGSGADGLKASWSGWGMKQKNGELRNLAI
ncbi:Leucine carboxyl methyltransferase 1 [Grifola frondosa]|uniref:Leucine carboxyl methyltransferase 1 n=1 Tax=Grifola frondosa TaxID=5627 RepID=A0A1C7M056_GRIFR|nr:Leucine carboxyl methyltransferase 1 [Grifola frondosa]